MYQESIGSASIAEHRPVPPCRCQSCTEATARADRQRLELLSMIESADAAEALLDQLYRGEFTAESRRAI